MGNVFFLWNYSNVATIRDMIQNIQGILHIAFSCTI